MSHTVALGYIFLLGHEHALFFFFWLNLIYTILLSQILARASKVELSTAKKIVPDKCTIFHSLISVLKTTMSSWKLLSLFFKMKLYVCSETNRLGAASSLLNSESVKRRIWFWSLAMIIDFHALIYWFIFLII